MMMRELPGNDEGHTAVFADPDAPYTGPGRKSLRTMAYNALTRAEMRRKARKGELEGYLDDMADSADSEAVRLMGEGYDSRRAWALAIRLVVHGQDPD